MFADLQFSVTIYFRRQILLEKKKKKGRGGKLLLYTTLKKNIPGVAYKHIKSTYCLFLVFDRCAFIN